MYNDVHINNVNSEKGVTQRWAILPKEKKWNIKSLKLNSARKSREARPPFPDPDISQNKSQHLSVLCNLVAGRSLYRKLLSPALTG